jgi:hypothetical protein
MYRIGELADLCEVKADTLGRETACCLRAVPDSTMGL